MSRDIVTILKELNPSEVKGHFLISKKDVDAILKELKPKKDVIIWDELKDYFILKTGKPVRLVSDKVKVKFRARLREGYKKEDFANAIINAAKSSYHIESNYEYLTLEYISRSDTLDKYSAVKNDSAKKGVMTTKFNTGD
jgi:uncharacterized phage protein (TIGR02220 family)